MNRHEKAILTWLAVAMIVVSLACWIGGSYMEARAYNNVTGKRVSTWDAMFIELRVQSEPTE